MTLYNNFNFMYDCSCIFFYIEKILHVRKLMLKIILYQLFPSPSLLIDQVYIFIFKQIINN